MTHSRSLTVFLLALACTPAARAGVVVEYKPAVADGWAIQGQNLTPVPGAVWNIALDRCNAGFWRVRVTDATSESLGLVSFTNSAAAITLLIGSTQDNDTNPNARFLAPGCLDWAAGLDPGAAAVTLQARVGRNIGPLASIQARAIVRLDADGAIHQSVIHHTSPTDTLAAITAGAGGTGGTGGIDDNLDDPSSPAAIRSEGGRIALISAAGSIMCPISVQPVAASAGVPLGGTLGRVESTAGDIGGARPSTSTADNYHATPIAARTIDAVIGRNIRSEIVGTEGVRRVESTFAGLRGSITAPTILPIDASTGGLVRATGVNAMNITLSNGLPKAATISAGLFYGYLNIPDASQPRITLGGADKLSGQILLNANNVPKPLTFGSTIAPRVLLGRVVVNGATTTTITTDTFLNPSPILGGGAIGVASFQLYELDCTPPNNQTARHDGVAETAFDNPANVPVVIRSYGPVVLPAGQTDPNAAFIIQRQSASDPCIWSAANSMFNVVLHPITPGTNEIRAVGLSRAGIHPTPAVYRVIPTALACGSVSGFPGVVWSDSCTGQPSQARAYTFRVAPDCDGNGINDYIQIDALHGSPLTTGSGLLAAIAHGTGGVGSGPIIAQDADTDPPPPPPPPPPLPPPPTLTCVTVCLLDINNDHVISVQDIFDYLTFWFAGDLKADFNQSGVIEVQDIFDYLNAWFNATRTDC